MDEVCTSVPHLLELYNTLHLQVKCSVLFNNTVR